MVSPYGHFSGEGEEFVVTRSDPPRHWYNYFWNDRFIGFASQVGFGESFAQDDLGRRIPLAASRQVYVADCETGDFWHANGLPSERSYTDYSCRHGLGYSQISLACNQIASSYRVFIPEDGLCEIWTVTLQNLRPEKCRVKVIPYFGTDLDGHYKPQGYNTATGYFLPEQQAVIGRSFAAFDSPVSKEIFAYLTSQLPATGYDSRKTAFIGTYGHEERPASLSAGGGCTNSDCVAEKLVFALENTVELERGQKLELHFVAGIAFSTEELGRERARFFTPGAIDSEWENAVSRFRSQIDGVAIDTPDENLNCLFNTWLKHQTNLGSRWARVRHNGYRDMTSDSECLGSINPELAWTRIKRVLSYQYSNGYAPRTFLNGSILDHNFADNTVWLTFAVYHALKELGRLELLEETVPFNDGTEGTVYEHIQRSIRFLWNFRSQHGLIKLWGGDWNDCLNAAGLKGQGVSVWLSIAWYRANRQFAEIARLKGATADAEEADRQAEEMKELVDRYGWDGEYYITAYTDEGVRLGSKENEEGKIFVLPQLWAVLSGISKDGKELQAMDAIDRYLERELGTLVSWPAFTRNNPSIGSMTQKPPGVHENGGVYLHPSVWKLAVDSMLKRPGKIQTGLEKILPFDHTWVEKKCEPYIMCNSYFSEETGYRYATPGQSWRTATGAWLAKSLVQYIFGLQPEMDGLRLDPCLPPSWKTCSIRKRFRSAEYRISYEQRHGNGCLKIAEIIVNGKPHPSPLLPYEENGQYEVKVWLE
ncbi:GH36-type glycosyl hydrolase domain-containing protein [Paenibacillus sp. YN15]|uniref:GH36-type glycosyl hydrolase domain-containing protein n=1 Tax=Paenibacillus sp. YN15 TaxID=1742774 RepID=UPI00215D54B9|nr:hypothetical protein [Paenibacillus sp. YN15]